MGSLGHIFNLERKGGERMSNEMKDFTIKLKCNEAFYRALVLMLRYAKKLGGWGSSRVVAIYFDGDGRDSIRELEISESVPESDKGILTWDKIQEMEPGWSGEDFLLDTDAVFGSVEG